MGERRDSYRVLVGKSEGTLGRCRNRWEEHIKLDIQVEGCEGWTELTWLRIRTSGGFW
jgi:3-oxoacyl-ACP reductase-like protein